MLPTSHTGPADAVQSNPQYVNEYQPYQQYGHSQIHGNLETMPHQDPEIDKMAIPVMLCHTCIDCGRMRSAGYHRNNPVVPGKPLVLTSCGRCVKRFNKDHRSKSIYTRFRSRIAEERCSWPKESVYIDYDRREHRGRRRTRENSHISQFSPTRPRVVKRSPSPARLGLRALQRPQRYTKSQTRMRISSLSPRRPFDEAWPPPDIVRLRTSRATETTFDHGGTQSHQAPEFDGVWPPPDIVPTHSYRKVESPPHLRRTSSRIIELSPSPPPTGCPRSARVVYTSHEQEYRGRRRSRSPPGSYSHGDSRSENVEGHPTSRPGPYPTSGPDLGPFPVASERRYMVHPFSSHRYPESPNRGILKATGLEREVSCQRDANMHDSQRSIHAEVRGPRVHFDQDQRTAEPLSDSENQASHDPVTRLRSDDPRYYHNYSQTRYVEDPQGMTVPLVEDFEKLRLRRSSVSPHREYEEEIRVNLGRRMSPSPPPHIRHEEIRVRYISPLPAIHRAKGSPTSRPLSRRPLPPGVRHVSRTRALSRTRSMTPPKAKAQYTDAYKDDTDSDSDSSGTVTEIRSWRGLDENGRPATFVEERTRVKMIEQGKQYERDFRPLNDRLASRSLRDV